MVTADGCRPSGIHWQKPSRYLKAKCYRRNKNSKDWQLFLKNEPSISKCCYNHGWIQDASCSGGPFPAVPHETSIARRPGEQRNRPVFFQVGFPLTQRRPLLARNCNWANSGSFTISTRTGKLAVQRFKSKISVTLQTSQECLLGFSPAHLPDVDLVHSCL